MASFARRTRTNFVFDEYSNAEDVEAGIDKAFYLGGYRSKIGYALIDSNSWVFQQSAGCGLN